MDNQNSILITNFIKLFHTNQNLPYFRWELFWNNFTSERPIFAKIETSELICQYSKIISEELNLLGRDSNIAREFLSLPLRYSKTVLSWPTNSEMIKELITD